MTCVVVETPKGRVVFAPATADMFERDALEITDTETEATLYCFRGPEWSTATVFDERQNILFSFDRVVAPIRFVTLPPSAAPRMVPS